MGGNVLDGDPRYYKYIAVLLAVCFAINGIALLLLNTPAVGAWLSTAVGSGKAHFVHLFFWGASGAVIACSLFMANDKEINEVEALKEKPNPTVLRFPNEVDVWLYLLRIVSSGFLAVVAAVITVVGLGYFDAQVDLVAAKHKLFFVLLSVLVGLFEKRFLASLSRFSERMFKMR